MRSSLTKEDILSFVDRKTVEVYVDQWEGYVNICQMSAKDRLYLEQKNSGRDTKAPGFMSNLVIDVLFLTLCDDNYERIFTEQEDLEKLGDKNPDAIKMLFEKASEINGLDNQTIEDDKKK